MNDIFDTHAHYEDEAFDADREAVLSALPRSGVLRVVNVSSTRESLAKTADLCRSCSGVSAAEKNGTGSSLYPEICGAYGLHPDSAGEYDAAAEAEIRTLAADPSAKAVAIGEIGLDYHWMTETKEVQEAVFRAQLRLARELHLPVIIHSRDAAADTLRIAKEENLGEIGGVMHCYSYSPEMAREYLEMGVYLGIGGVVTFKNSRKLKETVAMAPLSQLVLETDCPYLAPEPYRGRRNQSGYLPYVVSAIAAIKGISEDEVRRVTWENACRMYRTGV